MIDRLERMDRAIDRLEEGVLVLFLGIMLLLAFLQIVLRNVFSTGLAWGELLLRNLVLWIGFIGATLATREGRHINIDVLSRSLPPPGKAFVDLIIHLFSSLVCGLLTYAALKFVRNEVQMGTIPLLGIPVWTLEVILPITFGLMTFRFILRWIKSLSLVLNLFTTRGQEKP